MAHCSRAWSLSQDVGCDDGRVRGRRRVGAEIRDTQIFFPTEWVAAHWSGHIDVPFIGGLKLRLQEGSQRECRNGAELHVLSRGAVYLRAIETLSSRHRSPSPAAVKLIDENGVSDTIPKKLL